MANIDKVKLEQIIDKYLEQEIPLSFLTSEYKLSYPQIKLLINRANGYTRKTNHLYNDYPNSSYDNVSQSYISIPHEVVEEYPFDNEDQIALFKRLEELKNSIPPVSIASVRAIEEELSKCQRALQEMNTDEIVKAKRVAQDLANMEANGDEFEDVFSRNFLSPQEAHHLNQVYSNYLSMQEHYRILGERKVEAERDLKIAKKMNREIENIREELVTHNIKLVNFCIRYFFNSFLLPQDDVQAYGLEGLARAINGFDVNLNFQFSTYAVPTIVHTIQKHMQEMTGLKWEDFCRKEQIRYYRDLYRAEAGDESLELSPKELAESGLVPLTEKKIANNDTLIDMIVPLSDIQMPFEDEEEYGRRNFPATFEEYEQIDSYADTYEIGTEQNSLPLESINASLLEILESIPPRNAEALILRFGLLDGRTRTLAEVGKILNVTEERARQIEARGLRLLRHQSRTKELRGLKAYFDEYPPSTELVQLSPIEGAKKIR